MKTIITLLMLIILVIPASAVRIDNNGTTVTNFKPSGTAGYITLGNGNFSNLTITASNLIVNGSFYFNSTANITLSNISHSNDRLNFSGNATSGTLQVTAKMSNASYDYGLYIDNIYNKTITSNTTGFLSFDYNNWSQHDFSVKGYVAPILNNVIITPSSPTTTDNITAVFNITKGTYAITNYTIWYKNGVLQTTWNNSLIINYTNNYTNADNIYVVGWVGDGTQNTTTLQSNNVIIGSTNSAPTLSALTLIPSTKKNNQTININASGITDDSTSWQLQTYYKNGSTNVYIANSSWGSESSINITATIPFTTGGAHIIYAVIYDSGNVTGQSNLTSSELQQTFTSLTTDPTIESSSLSASSITIGGTVTITAQFNGQGANISSATVNVERPDATIANWTMTCDSGEIVNCTKSYTSTSDIGTYYIRYFYPTDTANITATISSVLTFTASAASVSSGGGGGGGGVVYINPTPSMTPSVNLSIIGITDGARSISDVERINKCLTDSFYLSNECTGAIAVTIKEQITWGSLIVGALFGAFGTLYLSNLVVKKKRSLIMDSLIYTVITVILLLSMNLIGFNFTYFFNYLMNSSLPVWLFLSSMMWAFLMSIVLDMMAFKRPIIYTVRKINL